MSVIEHFSVLGCTLEKFFMRQVYKKDEKDIFLSDVFPVAAQYFSYHFAVVFPCPFRSFVSFCVYYFFFAVSFLKTVSDLV